jgi:DeoR/GlpR family transcriptional regulator of sugar metabolism
MDQNERELEIQKILSREDYVTVKQLSQWLYTSESSIRRDLASLERRGLVKRSYGGVELVKRSTLVLPFSARAHYNIPAKKIMARKAAALVREGDIVFLDQSSSAFFVAGELQRRGDITVVTNNVEIIGLLSQSEMEVVSCGGSLS